MLMFSRRGRTARPGVAVGAKRALPRPDHAGAGILITL